MATRRNNYGIANNLGIIGACLIGNFFGLFLFICFLIWLPWWAYAIIVTAIVTHFIAKDIAQKDEKAKQLLHEEE